MPIDSAFTGIDGVDVYSLHYNSSILEVVDSSSGTSGIQITPGNLLPITLTNIVSNGAIQFSQVSSGGTSFTGSGKLILLLEVRLIPMLLAGGKTNYLVQLMEVI